MTAPEPAENTPCGNCPHPHEKHGDDYCFGAFMLCDCPEYAAISEPVASGRAAELPTIEITWSLAEAFTAYRDAFDRCSTRDALREIFEAAGYAVTDRVDALTEIERLRAQVAAAYAYAEQMGDYCSPHGMAARYADELRAALNNAKEAS